MERLSLRKGNDKINKESVKAFLSRVLYHDNWGENETLSWIGNGQYNIVLKPNGIFITRRFSNDPPARFFVDFDSIKSIGLFPISEGDDELGLYIDIESGPWIVVRDDTINIKREIYEMIERDLAEEFEW